MTPKVKHTDKIQTPKIHTFPDERSFKSSTVFGKNVPEDSSPYLSDHMSNIEVSC